LAGFAWLRQLQVTKAGVAKLRIARPDLTIDGEPEEMHEGPLQ
jgi:hypothetical protein